MDGIYHIKERMNAEEIVSVLNLREHAIQKGSAKQLFEVYKLLETNVPEDDMIEALQHALERSSDRDLGGDSDVGILYRTLYGKGFSKYSEKWEYDIDGIKFSFHMPYEAFTPEQQRIVSLKELDRLGLSTEIIH